MKFNTMSPAKPSNPYDVAGWNAYYEANPGYRRSVGADGDNGGEGGEGAGSGGAGGAGGAGGGANIQDTPEFKAALADGIRTAVDREVSGLKTKNEDVLSKLTAAQAKIEAFGDLDPASVKAMMDTLNQSEEAKLIAEGKIDEVIASRTEKIQSKFNDEKKTLADQLTEAQNGLSNYKQKFERKTIDDAIRAEAIKQGVLPHAMDDVIRRAGDVFSIGEDGTLEARDASGALLKDDNLMLLNPERFVDGLKKTAQHYWPASQGSGARGSESTGDYDDNMARLNDLAKKGDMEGYRALRKKMSGDDYQSRR